MTIKYTLTPSEASERLTQMFRDMHQGDVHVVVDIEQPYEYIPHKQVYRDSKIAMIKLIRAFHQSLRDNAGNILVNTPSGSAIGLLDSKNWIENYINNLPN